MKLDVTPLRCFLAVADYGSFSRAAMRLNMTQPSVTANVKALEAHLQLTLFERSTRSVALTKAGVDLVERARSALSELDQFKSAARKLARGASLTLRLGSAIYLQDFDERIRVVDGFAEAFPDAVLEVDFSFQDQLKLRLEADELDVALMISFPTPRSEFLRALDGPDAAELLVPDDWPRIVLQKRPVLLGVPQESPLAQRDVVLQSDLAGATIVAPSSDHGAPFVEQLRAPLIEAGARLVTPPEGHGLGVERYGTRRRLPAITFGWFPARPGQMDDMVALPVEGLDVETEFSAVFSAGAATPAASLFRGYLEKSVRE